MYNAIHLYRLARWLYLHHIPLIPMMIQLIIFCGYGCRLSYKTKIGKGTFLSHGGLGVTVSPKSEIGEGCVLGFRCSIVGQPPYIRTPKIGNHVYISPGAVIQGPLIIGDHVIIAANSVVTKSVPVEIITPEKAKNILENNINRKLNARRVNQYAEDLLRIAKIISSVDVFFLWLVMLSVGVIASKG